ncbi:MAG: maleylpyruvate isomerase N-terminal domain-containing protein, partial [Actinomycetales bacterium]|nr:maleylpyruvate isomerase N-terminal domain-containing protein [Actinomycetales bacterium]
SASFHPTATGHGAPTAIGHNGYSPQLRCGVIALQEALEHMAWADRKLFAFLSELPDQAWHSRAHAQDWPVSGLVFHLVASADWYRYQLGGVLEVTSQPQSIADVRQLSREWQQINEFLVAEAAKEDGLVSFTEDGSIFSELRSTVLMEAFRHSTEHRTQIAAALKAGGHAHMELEDYSAWAFRDATARP